MMIINLYVSFKESDLTFLYVLEHKIITLMYILFGASLQHDLAEKCQSKQVISLQINQNTLKTLSIYIIAEH